MELTLFSAKLSLTWDSDTRATVSRVWVSSSSPASRLASFCKVRLHELSSESSGGLVAHVIAGLNKC